MNHAAGFGFLVYMANLNSLNYIVQDLQCQFFNIGIISKMGIDFSALHRSCKRSYLLQHIGIKHIVVDSMCFRTFIGAMIMVHA